MSIVSGARGGPRGIPTSRAYWDLQAEKLLNRVFEPAEMIDLDPIAADAEASPAGTHTAPATAPPPADPAPTAASAPLPRHRRARRPGSPATPPPPPSGQAPSHAQPLHRAALPASLRQPLLLLAVFAGAGLITAGSGVLALSQWTRFQESLQQERNLLLVERLRSFGPAAQPAPATPPAPALTPPQPSSSAVGATSLAQEGEAGLPPPPPAEPWIQELSTLPQPQRSPALLRVPVSPALRAATAPGAPAAPPRPRTPAGPVPLLVGVVAVPGKAGSAIFQMGGSTSTVSVGDSIGSSGWRLIASDGDGVQIEHQGEIRRISIGGGG